MTLDQLKKDIAKMRKARKQKSKKRDTQAHSALRAGSDMLGALITGAGLGYVMDEWLNSTPWLMGAGLFLGLIAGTRLMLKYAQSQNKS